MRKRRERCEPPPSNFLPPASPCFWSAGPPLLGLCAVLVCVHGAGGGGPCGTLCPPRVRSKTRPSVIWAHKRKAQKMAILPSALQVRAARVRSYWVAK